MDGNAALAMMRIDDAKSDEMGELRGSYISFEQLRNQKEDDVSGVWEDHSGEGRRM